jgi:hypothetical protein
MAPEVLILGSRKHRWAEGYTYMSDYWSLGVMLYFMLVKDHPFPSGNIDEDVKIRREGQIAFPDYMSPDCVHFICSLLKVDEKRRLGWGVNGLEDIKNHPFFLRCDEFKWNENVLKKACVPPFVPADVYDYSTPAPKYNGFQDLPLDTVDGTAVSIPNAAGQECFKDWNYVAPTTLRIEFGLANESKQYEENIKLQKLLGDSKRITGPRTLSEVLTQTFSPFSSAKISPQASPLNSFDGSALSTHSNSPYSKLISNLPRRESGSPQGTPFNSFDGSGITVHQVHQPVNSLPSRDSPTETLSPQNSE